MLWKTICRDPSAVALGTVDLTLAKVALLALDTATFVLGEEFPGTAATDFRFLIVAQLSEKISEPQQRQG
jgi:hypothetical protein